MAKNENRTLTDDEKRVLIVEKRIKRLEKMLNEDAEYAIDDQPKKKSLVERYRER